MSRVSYTFKIEFWLLSEHATFYLYFVIIIASRKITRDRNVFAPVFMWDNVDI